MADNNLTTTALKNGDPAAERAFIRQYHPLIKRFLIRYCGFDDRLDDIIQETWIKVFNNIHQFKHNASIETWLIRIAINTAKTVFKKETSNASMENNDIDRLLFDDNGSWKKSSINWQSSNPETAFQGNEIHHILNKAITELPDQQKDVLMLHDIENLDFKHICNILQISESNARVLLHRARKQLWFKVNAYQEKQAC